MQRNHFSLVKTVKNTASAQLCWVSKFPSITTCPPTPKVKVNVGKKVSGSPSRDVGKPEDMRWLRWRNWDGCNWDRRIEIVMAEIE